LNSPLITAFTPENYGAFDLGIGSLPASAKELKVRAAIANKDENFMFDK